MMGIFPWILPEMRFISAYSGIATGDGASTTEVTVGARPEDVAGKSPRVGQPIEKPTVVLPMAVYFDSVARVDPKDPNSAEEGIGRFNIENYSLHLLGVPVWRFSGAGMTTSRWAFDGLFPFIALIVFSLLTKPEELERADRFFAKMRTPVAATPELDRQEVQLSFRCRIDLTTRKSSRDRIGNSRNGIGMIFWVSGLLGDRGGDFAGVVGCYAYWMKIMKKVRIDFGLHSWAVRAMRRKAGWDGSCAGSDCAGCAGDF